MPKLTLRLQHWQSDALTTRLGLIYLNKITRIAHQVLQFLVNLIHISSENLQMLLKSVNVRTLTIYQFQLGLVLRQESDRHPTRKLVPDPDQHQCVIDAPVLRIGDIWIWIRIRGSIPPNNRSGPRSSYFRHWPSIYFFYFLFCLLLFEATLTSFFKEKKS